MSTPEEHLPGIERALEGEDLTPEARERIIQNVAAYAASFALRFGHDSRIDETLMVQDYVQEAEPTNEQLQERLSGRLVELAGDPVERVESATKLQLQATLEAYNHVREKLLVIDAVLMGQPMRASAVVRDMLRFVEEHGNAAYQEYDRLNGKKYGEGR